MSTATNGSATLEDISPHPLADLPEGTKNPLDYALTQRDGSTLAMVRAAVAHNQTLMAYQPVMRDADDPKIAFYEGFIRILDPTGRVIPAREFMPVVEKTQLGREIDVLSLNAGLAALSENKGLRLSINMSARSIGYAGWTTLLNRWLSRDGTIGERLILEISEKSAMQMPELVASFMDQLQTRGVCFALDNFGSDYIAIRYLKEMFFDILKIDGQFARGVSDHPDNRAIVSIMVSIARNFDMITVAEQVENQDDASLLLALGVDCQQGFLYGAPTTQPYWQSTPEERKNA
ncbi:MAG: EAL domain-containing protein [Sulfitobacter pontiacus]